MLKKTIAEYDQLTNLQKSYPDILPKRSLTTCFRVERDFSPLQINRLCQSGKASYRLL